LPYGYSYQYGILATRLYLEKFKLTPGNQGIFSLFN
jgi:hypothetical protein